MPFNIDTGYKPEFGLGAVYAGENAANNEMASQLELVKQFLANQHAQRMDPLTEQRKQQEITMDQYKEAPEYQQAMTDTMVGQSKSSMSAGRKAEALLPFVIAAEQAKNQSDAGQQNMLSRFFNASNRQYDQSLPEAQRIAAAQERNALQGTIGETTDLYSKRSLQDDELASRERIAAMNADAMRDRAQAAQKPPAELDLKKQLQRVESMMAGLTPIPDGISVEQLQQLATQLRHDIMISNPGAFQQGKPEIPGITRSPSAVEQNRQDIRGQTNKPALPSGWTMK